MFNCILLQSVNFSIILEYYDDDIPQEVLDLGTNSRFGFSNWIYITEPDVMNKIYDLDVKYCQVIQRVSTIFIIKILNNKSHINHDHYPLLHSYALGIQCYLKRKITKMMMTNVLMSLGNKFLLQQIQGKFYILIATLQHY